MKLLIIFFCWMPLSLFAQSNTQDSKCHNSFEIFSNNTCEEITLQQQLVFLKKILTDPAYDENKKYIVTSTQFLEDEKKKMGQPFLTHDAFQSEDLAHLEAAKRYWWAAKKNKTELFWWVYKLPDGTYTFSYPNVSDSDRLSVKVFAPDTQYKATSSAHIHWNEMIEFSKADWRWIRHKYNDHKRSYLIAGTNQIFYADHQIATKLYGSSGIISSLYTGEHMDLSFIEKDFNTYAKIYDYFYSKTNINQ